VIYDTRFKVGDPVRVFSIGYGRTFDATVSAVPSEDTRGDYHVTPGWDYPDNIGCYYTAKNVHHPLESALL